MDTKKLSNFSLKLLNFWGATPLFIIKDPNIIINKVFETENKEVLK